MRITALALLCTLLVSAAAAQPTPNGRDAALMVLIPAGPFLMGSDRGGDPDEGPRRTLRLPAFWMDVREVTNAQYKRFCDETGRRKPLQWKDGNYKKGQEEWPVTNVTWDDASAYAKWAGKRLPTEAEWERAARGTNGREYPWGDAADPKRLALEDEKALGPVGRFPAGASPYGCLDMAGNAWEWTADWYEKYQASIIKRQAPGSSALHPTPYSLNPYLMVMTATYTPLSPHYGRKYKVVRGGGAIGYYGIPNTGRCADRARMLPFASYDGTGFRCAMSVEGGSQLQSRGARGAVNRSSQATLARAPELGTPGPRGRGLPRDPASVSARPLESPNTGGRPNARRPPPTAPTGLDPVPPRVKAAPQVFRSPVILTVKEPAGVARQGEVVTSGIPFPEGALRDTNSIRLVGQDGNEIPVDREITGTWRDRSIQWLLITFPCTIKAGEQRTYSLEWGQGVRPRATVDPGIHPNLKGSALFLQDTFDVAGIDRLQWVPRTDVSRDQFPRGERLARRSTTRSALADAGGDQALWVTSDHYEFAGVPSFVVSRSVMNVSSRQILPLRRWTVSDMVKPPVTIDEVRFGGDGVVHSILLEDGQPVTLRQTSDREYVVFKGDKPLARGTRAQGWLTARSGTTFITYAIRDFWQQFPMALQVRRDGVSLTLWDSDEPFELDRGMAKTVTTFGHVGRSYVEGETAARAFQQPLFAVAPPEWVCGTGALGELAPYDINRFPEYETPVEADLDLWVRSRPYGFRNWGDAYMGGEFKGKNAYNNLEYDIPYDFFMQFARTGNRKYLDAAVAGARHQADIDTNHLTGQPWKHSPRHTETPAELGHVFLRGLIAYTHFTGDPRGLETAKRIGDWLCKAINNRSETGNERQIGWGLYALTAVYGATWDEKYLNAMKTFVDRLVAEQEPTGKFNIRWDNRIAFFNGLAMAGLRRYYEVTGDEKVAQAVLRLADRTLGMYPEYAGRTLDGFVWAYERTGDPRYHTMLARTWETTLEYNLARHWGPASTLFATRYPPYLLRRGLAPLPEKPLTLTPAQLATEDGLHLTRVEAEKAALFIRDDTGRPFDLVILRHGCVTPGRVVVTTADGKQRWLMGLGSASRTTTRAAMTVPARKPGVLKVELIGAATKAWDLVTSRPLPRVLHAPDFAGLKRLTPRAYFTVMGDAFKAVFDAAGEGFHGAVLYDPDGRPVQAVSEFIDLGDKGTYRLEISAPIPPGQRGRVWSLDIQDADLASLAGAEPYFASTRAAHFRVR